MNKILFVALTADISKEIIRININFNKYDKADLQQELLHFFYYNRHEEKLYYAEINSIKKCLNERIHIRYLSKKVSYKKSNDKVCLILFKSGLFQIEFKNTLSVYPKNILRDMYAKSNIGMIGDRTYSIYHTIQFSRFPYAIPVVDQSEFMLNDKFSDLLLYDYGIIPDMCEKRKSFAKIINEDGELFLTLTNEKMLKVDYEYLTEQKHKKIYRPYFYEFILNEESQEKLKYTLSHQQYNEEELFEVKIISISSTVKDNEKELLEGDLLFSASPIKSIRAYINILFKNNNKGFKSKFEQIEREIKNQICPTNDKNKIENKFMGDISLITNIKYEIKVFNVGQGNWIHIFIYSNEILVKKIIFDIGVGRHSDKKLRKSIMEMAASEIMDNYMFVLSHWDLDHIQGVVELEKNQFDTTWIMPDLPVSPSNSAKRLAAFLFIEPTINPIFIDHSLNGELLFENNYFKLGKGRGEGPGKIVTYTKENNIGLILVIKKGNQRMLFPGDCEYSQFPSCFIKHQNYDALIVSHHGAKVNNFNLTSNSSTIEKFAAICNGKDPKKYSYPEKNHKESLEKLGYIIHETKKFKDIDNPCQFILK
ncbi:hypothetical protein [Sporosarcina ureae]|uniref:hypothetical protein n=1 Tax=Sporosarcina ureae TaxID=1571 RepID=UPI0028A7B9A4|nr:hypothetical protein [Sporosarcina ureae]